MKPIKPLTPEQKRRAWEEPESNAGAGWWPDGRNHGPDDYDRPLGRRRSSIDPIPVDRMMEGGEED